MNSTKARRVLLTGASRGIGAASVRAFAAAGDRVALIARDGAAITALAAEVGGLALPCDVAEGPALAAAVARVQAEWGGVDILVNNAAVIAPMAPLAAVDPGEWARAVTINLTGVFHGIRAVLPGMLAQGGGTVITVSSGAAHKPYDGWSAYCAAKAGAAMLMRSLHLEYGAQGIRAIGLSPGTVATDMQRAIKASGLGPVAQLEWSDHIPPDWVAQTLVWLCGPGGNSHAGTEVSLRDAGLRKEVGLT